MLKIFSLLILIPNLCSAFPVVDVSRQYEKILEAIAVGGATAELVDTLTTSYSFAKDIQELSQIAQDTKNDIETLRSFGQQINELEEYDMNEFDLLVNRIDSITNYIKQVRTIVASLSMAMSADGLQTAIQAIREQRQREDQIYFQRLQVIEQKRKLRISRNKVRRKVDKARIQAKELAKIRMRSKGRKLRGF